MTRLALVAEIRGDMDGARRLGIVGLMTLVAISVRYLIVPVDVARLAWRRRVQPG